MRMLLITGSPRTGTTFVSRWLEQQRGGAFCTKESGILHVANWWLSSARFLSRVCEFQDLFVEQTRRTVEAFYRRIGWDGEGPIIEKQNYSQSDIDYYYDHLERLFGEDLCVLYTLRDPLAVIRSMRNRTWGEVRGSVLHPRPLHPYWDPKDINNVVSPMAHRLSAIENCVGDEAQEDGHQGRWSIDKCCAHYTAATDVTERLASLGRCLVLDYDRLDEPAYREFVRSWVQDVAGIAVDAEIPFQRPGVSEDLSDAERGRAEELLAGRAQAQYESLRGMAREQEQGARPRS